MEITFIDNDYAIAVSNYIMKGYTIEQAKAAVIIDADLAVSDKLDNVKDKDEAKRLRHEAYLIRKEMRDTYGKENLVKYIVAKRADKFKALTEGYHKIVPHHKPKT